MNRLEILCVERERIIKTLGKENKNRVKLLTMLMDVDDEIEEILASELKSGSLGLVNNPAIINLKKDFSQTYGPAAYFNKNVKNP